MTCGSSGEAAGRRRSRGWEVQPSERTEVLQGGPVICPCRFLFGLKVSQMDVPPLHADRRFPGPDPASGLVHPPIPALPGLPRDIRHVLVLRREPKIASPVVQAVSVDVIDL